MDSPQPHQHGHGAVPGYDTGTPDRLLDTAFAFWRSALLVQAHDVGIFAELARGPRDAATLSRALGLRPEAAAAFLEALAALGMVTLRGDQYANTPDADRFLDPAKPSYVGRWLVMAQATLRDLPDLTARLRAPGGERQERTLAERMWADVAEILGMGEGV
jgi:hypothetical protein